MLKRFGLPVLCFLFLATIVLAQDLPDEIDNYDGNWEGVIEQLLEFDYIAEANGGIVLEDESVRFVRSNEQLIEFDTNLLSNIIIAGTLYFDPISTEGGDDYEFCMFSFRDVYEEGYIGVGLDNDSDIFIADYLNDHPDSEDVFVNYDHFDSTMRQDIHVMVVALEDTVTVYVNGEHFIQESNIRIRQGVVALVRTTLATGEETGCTADDVWIWAFNESPVVTTAGDPPPTLLRSFNLPQELDVSDTNSESIIEQLIDSEYLGNDNIPLLSDLAFSFTGEDREAEIIGIEQERSNVIMGAEITFNPVENDGAERCLLLARVEEFPTSTNTVYAGIDSEGDVVMGNITRNGEESNSFIPAGFDLSESHHLLVVVRGNRLAAYYDGLKWFEDYPIDVRQGSYGAVLFSNNDDTSCEIDNLWVYDTPFFEDGVCNAVSSANVNRRTGPGTNYTVTGQLIAGQSQEIRSQTSGTNGFSWYELGDGSFVREDTISLTGDCGDIPEFDD